LVEIWSRFGMLVIARGDVRVSMSGGEFWGNIYGRVASSLGGVFFQSQSIAFFRLRLSFTMPENHALVFGASGITGWAITNQILKGYPEAGTFKKVTALTNRPLKQEATLWPTSDKLQLVSGLDLMNKNGQKALEDEMKRKIKDVDTVTHVFFFGIFLLFFFLNQRWTYV
jgi:hypothetical protein